MVAEINPMSPLVLPISTGTSRDSCFCSPMAGSDAFTTIKLSLAILCSVRIRINFICR